MPGLRPQGQDLLRAHYNHKYAAGSVSMEKQTVIPRRWPVDRFEAAVAFAGTGKALLEIGAGSGTVMASLADRFQTIVGLELSDERAALLRKRFANEKNYHIVTADIESCPSFIEAPFDTIIMNALIEHLIDPIRVLRYVRTLLAPDGRVVIITPNIAKWTRRVKLLLGRFPSTASLDEGLLLYDRKNQTELLDEGHLHYFTFRSLKRVLIERCGFIRVDEYGYGRAGRLSHYLRSLISDCCVVGSLRNGRAKEAPDAA